MGIDTTTCFYSSSIQHQNMNNWYDKIIPGGGKHEREDHDQPAGRTSGGA